MTLKRIQKIEMEVASRLRIPQEHIRAVFYLNEDLDVVVICEIFCGNGYAVVSVALSDDDEQVISRLVTQLREDYAQAISALQRILEYDRRE